MPLSPEQTATLAAMRAENDGVVSHHFKGHVLKRDGRLVPLTDPAERHRAGDADALNIEQGDEPADVVLTEKDADGEAKEVERIKQPNRSPLTVEAVA